VAHDRLKFIVEAIDRLPHSEDFLARLTVHLGEMLERALELHSTVSQANSDFDYSVIDRPSIQPHDQNHNFREWAVMFDLLWRAWRQVDASSGVESRALVQHWRQRTFLAFRRLVIAAMTVSPNFTTAEKIEVLLDA
jgi:hypothetical protein